MQITHPQNVFKKREKVNMSDDLVKRLRCYADLNDAVFHPWVYGEAADRIEKLETNFQLQLEWYLSNKRVLDDRIEKLESALREIIGALDDPKGGQHVYDMRNASYIARKALGGKDD
jgi:hypothetical protein